MKICSILVLLTGSVFAAFSFWPSSDDSLDVRVEFVNRVVNKDGEFVVRRSTRIQKGNGDWQEKSQYFKRDGTSLSEVTTLGIGGQGVISIKPATQELIYLGERPSGYRPSFNPSEAKKIVGYEREDVVAGQKVLVFSGKDGPTIFLAADLNGMMLKTVEGDDVVEAVVVEYKRFEIESVPDWPVSYRSYEKKIEAVKTVDKNLADQLKKALPPK